MQKELNLKIKFRESFRPFAPSILEAEADKWFDLKTQSPYMMFVSKIKLEKQFRNNEKQKIIGSGKIKF